ncbi:MAG: hydrogenase/urease maturation nickel metallochaperone HypA [Planctomycetes bacterium]|nr:hydrogenase/urease maturation nickel metallochaperone HypA [Planctomycetota bacterium]
MHEASLMRDLMRKVMAVAAGQNASRVTGIRVRLGALSHMTPGHFQEHFDEAARGTVAEGARIETLEDNDIRSPAAADVVLESIEVE